MANTVKKIWLVNYYAMPPELESRLRTIKFAQYLTKMGYEVTIIASSFMHNMNKNLINDNSKYIHKNYNGLNFVHIFTKGYQNNGIKRLLSLFEFHFKLFRYNREFQKPDLIIHTALPPFGNIVYFIAKKFKIKYIVEVLDLWPDSFVDMNLIKKNNPILKLLYFSEKWLYKKADAVVFSMEGGKDYIIDKKWDKQTHNGPIDIDKIYYINNGVDLKDFDYFKNNFKLTDVDLENKEIKKVIYIGSIRLANNLKSLINAAELLVSNSNIKFLLYGDGEDRESLEKYCKDKQINNVIFKEKWIDPKYVPYVLTQSAVNILNYAKGFGKYGGSQSKLFQYMASGNPICSNLKMNYCPIRKYNLGIAKEFESDEEYADAILKLAKLDSESLKQIKINELELVRDFDYEELTKKIVNTFC